MSFVMILSVSCMSVLLLTSVLRQLDVLIRTPFFYNNFLLITYCVSVFFILPWVGESGSGIVSFSKEILSSVQILEDTLIERGVSSARSFRVMVSYSFSVIWVFLSTSFVVGLSIGMNRSDCKVMAVDEKSGGHRWSFLLVFGGASIFLVGILLVSEYVFSPLERLDEKCSKTCSYLQYGVFPYFAKMAFIIYVWNFFLMLVLKSIAWKITKGRFEDGK